MRANLKRYVATGDDRLGRGEWTPKAKSDALQADATVLKPLKPPEFGF